MEKAHFSWKSQSNPEDTIKYIEKLPVKEIPIVDKETSPEKIEDLFFNDTGCFIVKGLYSEDVMERFNKWTLEILEEAKKDPNSRHPIQEDKFLINDLLYRMSATDPELLLDIFNKDELYHFSDVLLGFTFIGSSTVHYTTAKGKRQQTHVDYPLHLNSSSFWGGDINKLKRFTTRYQEEKILPRHSIQILIAPQKMNKNNGSTEVITCSQQIPDIDLNLHNRKVSEKLENRFINAELEKGDALFFNRRLVHRGGSNISESPRNALILQCEHLWAIPQETFDFSKVRFNMFIHDITIPDEFFLRLKQPYPKDVKKET